ncbi:hypothetical protein EMIHUDRAFT_234877 [Emiliania huxleyi CCMP1516]|uniref:DUF3611 family protein n=2 Tax=Emiliania huxleyi TaxID=2903 RepID=A0A0D3JXN6_EMIH1|nr:hypothetical protein EMIHUDRAFT_234877 [Emiliania huxleyi CCMP1516]EOD28271.1 hypothetical protein EMIHUDRAFT_234877 [Emiliania huxleyi CCMP1516]|eukprot:XP_005780700.1 hypothetical protein EMIHUDRAFT_234877 [Emiliania huxleyi CCMP1516]
MHMRGGSLLLLSVGTAALRLPPPAACARPTLASPVRAANPALSAPRAAAARRTTTPVLAATAPPTPLTQLASRLWSWGWLNWWVQGALSVVGAVLLLFANSVSSASVSAPALAGRALALAACATSFASTFWQWGYTRLAVRIRRRPERWTAASAASNAARALYVGTALNLVGIGIAIVGAEAIVGNLAAKALTQGSAVVLDGRAAAATVQALDVLIVQANTNTIAACFFGLLTSMRLKLAAATAERAAEA